MTQKHFYLTTAIDYPNGAPHMGHAYEKVVTDAYARWYRLAGYKVFFLTGTDENGQKLVKSAAESGQPTQAFIDSNVAAFRSLCERMHISFDDFIRTTEDRHKKVSQRIWRTLEERGDIYFDRYTGNYCIGCEAFYTATQAPEQKCPNHGTQLQFIEEDGYFFRMGKYQDWIREHIENNSDFLFPSSARKEILGRLNAEKIHDLSISRPNQGWGIAVPGNDKHVMYTWFDALINYYSAVADTEREHEFWPAQMHVIGKDITWFHAVIWPTMLHAAGIPLPKQVYVHGMLLDANGRKMSKSLNNGVDPVEMLNKYNLDSFRYFLLRSVSSGMDGNFSEADIIARHNNELANDLGNLLMRTVKLTMKRLGTSVLRENAVQELNFDALPDRVHEQMERREHHRALDLIWEALKGINIYLNEKEPWRIKDDTIRFHDIMYNTLHGLAVCSFLLRAFLPTTAETFLKTMGVTIGKFSDLGYGGLSFQLAEPLALFPKIETPKG